jgi:hypothetical protein
MDKQNVVSTVNSLLLNLKKECKSDTLYNMNEPLKHYTKWNEKDISRHILYDSTHVMYLE